MITIPHPTPRARRWLLAALVALSLYGAAGSLLVPALVRQQLPQLARAHLEREASVQEVRFNPFALRLLASGLRLADKDGTSLLDIGQLVVELQWRSVLRRAWSFAEIRITEPDAHVVIAEDGRVNFADLHLPSQQQAPADAGLPRLIIERLVLERGRIGITDRQAGYANELAPIDLALNHFSTLPDQRDSHTFVAESASGGKLLWRGSTSLNPVRAQGEITLQDVPLDSLAAYLKGYTHALPTTGSLTAVLPYSFSYAQGNVQARLSGARLSVRALSLAREASAPFAALDRLEVGPVEADYAQRSVRVRELRVTGGFLHARRDAQGVIDLATLGVVRAREAPPTPGRPAAAATSAPWKVDLESVQLDKFALEGIDESAGTPVRAQVGAVRFQSRVRLEQTDGGLQAKADDTSLSLSDLQLASGTQVPLRLSRAGLEGGSLDLAARRIDVQEVRAEKGDLQVVRDPAGRINLLSLLPPASPSAQDKSARPWAVAIRRIELGGIGAALEDQGSGLRLHVQDFGARIDGAGSDLRQPFRFQAGLRLREGGRITAEGSMVPATTSLQADLQVASLALAPVQPLLARQVKLTLRQGELNARGRLRVAGGSGGLHAEYAGSLGIHHLALHEEDGELFAGWKEIAADKLRASLGPDLLEIPELRVLDAKAKLIIEEDRSLNAARLLVRAPSDAPPARADPAAAPFPVRIGTVRVRNATLDFADLSLRPQFGARIEELSGVVNGLSTARQVRSQVELDGRVGEFGAAQVRGELNAYAPSENTDLMVGFRNVDLVPASPYSMKFAGYRIAGGKLSLDLQYKVADRKLRGDNRIVLDQLTLGERVESPDALKLPLQLAIAILTDNDGRIDLGLPVSGDLDDPQFSYGALVWKAIGNLLTRIVTAPFRALGSALGLKGESMEAIGFEPGSADLRPPEREKLQQLAQLLHKRSRLKLTVPGQYDPAADAAALREGAVRREVARRAGLPVPEGQAAGPVNLSDRATRKAVRELYAARFGDAALDERKAAAEKAGRQPDAPGLAFWQRAGNLLQGEPQLADTGPFHRGLLEALYREQPLPADALAKLGAQRAASIVDSLRLSGLEAARARTTAAEPIVGEASARTGSVAVKPALALD